MNCRFCKKPIIHDGGHWARTIAEAKVQFATVTEMTQALRNCRNAPTMVRFHVPELDGDIQDVQEARKHTRCFPEVGK